ncbi:MAG: 2-oxo acid dehydrogenase subunit E2 [Clostridia bacterium]
MKKKKYVTWDVQKRIIAFMTTEAWKTTPHSSFNYEAQVTDFFAEFRKINATRSPENKFTFNSLMLKVVVEGLKAAPHMNAFIHYNKHTGKGRLDLMEDIHISMPTILSNGRMMALKVANCESKNVDELSDYVKALKLRCDNTNMLQAMTELSLYDTVKDGFCGKPLKSILKFFGSQIGQDKLRLAAPKEMIRQWKVPKTKRLVMDDLQLGTISVSNFGSTYVKLKGSSGVVDLCPFFTTALVIGSAQDKPCLIDGELAVGKVMPIGIVYDSRALDLNLISPFIEKLDEIFANPQIIYSWLSPEKDTVAQKVSA